MSEPIELNLSAKIADLKEKTASLINDVREKIHDLKVLEARAVKYEMKDEADLIHEYIIKLQDIQSDFRSIFFIKLDNLYNEIEMKEKQDIVALDFQEQLSLALDYVPDYIEDKRNLYEEYYRDLEAISERWNKSKL